jgi:hypothetical protein
MLQTTYLELLRRELYTALVDFNFEVDLSHFPARQCSCGHGEDHAGTGFGATLLYCVVAHSIPLQECH